MGFERVVFADRAERNDAVDPIPNQVIDDPLCIAEVDRQILMQLRGDRGKYTGPWDRHDKRSKTVTMAASVAKDECAD
jgi:hypothetical protein